MIKYLWGGMIIIGVTVGCITGRAEELASAMIKSAESSAALALSLIGVYALWLGLLKIAEEAGMIKTIAKASKKLITAIFRGLKKEGEAAGLITMNLVANMLGMGNAATPFGLRAMQALHAENDDKKRPSDAMCTFLILNTASVQLIPLSIIAVRSAAGAKNPSDIVPTAFLATLITAVVGVVLAKLCAKVSRIRESKCRR